MRNLEKLRHASSRKVVLEKRKRVLKFYPSIYGFLLHDLAFFFFSLLFFQTSPPISPKKRIMNEIKGRKILKQFGIKTTQLISFSLKEKFLEEKLEEKALTLDDLEMINPKKASRVVMKIGKITKKLNEKNIYFIDNRASNWMYNKSLIRTDLELLKKSKRSKRFFIFCDILSFISTLKSEKIKEKFLEGYGEKIKISTILQLLVMIYIRFTDIIF